MSVLRPEFVVPVTVSGAVSAGTLAATIVLPFDAEVVAISGGLGTAPSAGAVTLDVLKNGSTIYTGAQATAPKAVFAQSSRVSSVSKALRLVPNSSYALGAGGAAYAAGTNVITPYAADGQPLANVTGGTDYLQIAVSGTVTSAADLYVSIVLARK